MGWLFGQIWILCAIAFVAGSGVTWLVTVVPARRNTPVQHGPTDMAEWAADPWAGYEDRPEPRGAPPPGPAVDPALAALDTHEGARHRAGTAAAATGALESLGITDATRPDSAESAAPDPVRPPRSGQPDTPPATPTTPTDVPTPRKGGSPPT